MEKLTNQKTLELKIKHDGKDAPSTKIYQRLFEYERLGDVEDLAELQLRLEEKSHQFVFECGVVTELRERLAVAERALDIMYLELTGAYIALKHTRMSAKEFYTKTAAAELKAEKREGK